MRGEGLMTVPSPSETDIRRFRLQLRLSKLGLGLILLFDAIQIVSNHYPDEAASNC